MNPSALDRSRHTTINRVAAGLALVCVICIPLFVPNFRTERDPDGPPFAGDFLQEYLGGYIILHGDYERFYDPEYAYTLQHDPAVLGMSFSKDQFLPIIYPPFYYLLMSPFACLPFHTAGVIWYFLMAACLGLTIWLLARAYPEHSALPAWALAGAFLFAPLLENLNSCQKATLALLILTATFLLLDRRRPFCAGLIFGLLAFKPQLTLVIAIAMLCKREGRFVLGGMVTGTVLVGLSLLVSTDVCAQYFQISTHMADYINTAGFPLEKMHCWYGFFKLLLGDGEIATTRIATLIAGGVTVAVLTRLLWGPFAYGRSAFAVQFAGLVLATLLLSPHLLTYDLTLLLLPFFLIIHLLLKQDSIFAGRQTWVISLIALLFVMPGISPSLTQHTHVQLTVPLLFVLLAALAALQNRPSEYLATEPR